LPFRHEQVPPAFLEAEQDLFEIEDGLFGGVAAQEFVLCGDGGIVDGEAGYVVGVDVEGRQDDV
jgi:hypothetical protein